MEGISSSDQINSDNRVPLNHPLEHEVTEIEVTPYVGMEFDTEEHAYRFYDMYAGFIGFSVRKDWVNKSKLDKMIVLSRRYVCFKEGFKKQTNYEGKKARKDIRTGCLAQMVIGRQSNGNYMVTYFEKQHTHELVTPQSRHKLPSQRKISIAQAAQVDQATRPGIRQKLIFEFLSRQSGGRENVGCTLKDISNHLTSKRMKEMEEGEAYTLIHYFESRKAENPSFFYAIQLDVDDQITNIFWEDAKMVIDYVHFGDVICFDTTYRTNKNFRPFTPIIGFNHHQQTVIFGATLLYDETAESFQWLFEIFLKAMCGKMPTTIFTDQDAAMAKAIQMVFPNSYHHLCLWHLFQNALKNVNHAFKKSDLFATDLRNKHGLRENKWMKDLFEKREKWALVYGRHNFSAGVTTTQLSESFNSRLRGYMKSTFKVLEFFRNFDRMLEDMRYKELESNYDMTQKTPSLHMDIHFLKIARDAYKPTIFYKVQEEYEKAGNILLKECYQNLSLYQYKVCKIGQMKEHKVTFNSEDQTVVCSCQKFEFLGILCGYAHRVLSHWNIIIIPQKYILKRWTKDARNGCVLDSKGHIIKEDPKLLISNRFKDLCRNAVEIAGKAAESEEATTFFKRRLIELGVEVDRFLSKSSTGSLACFNKHVNLQVDECTASERTIIEFEENKASKVKGIKKKDGVSRVKS